MWSSVLVRCCRVWVSRRSRDGDLHLADVAEDRAVVHAGDRDDVLGLCETDPGVRLRDARRREVEADDAGVRIALGDDHHLLDVAFRRHRPVDAHRHRHGVAVLGDLGEFELDLPFTGSLPRVKALMASSVAGFAARPAGAESEGGGHHGAGAEGQGLAAAQCGDLAEVMASGSFSPRDHFKVVR